MKKRLTLTLIIIISIAFGQTGIEIAKMVDAKPSPKDMSNTTRMVLTNAKGKSRTNVWCQNPLMGIKNRTKSKSYKKFQTILNPTDFL